MSRTTQSTRYYLAAIRGALYAVILAACMRLPHVDPRSRDEVTASRASVDVHVTCSSPDMSSTEDSPKPAIVWREPSRGRGVMISERHILTAAHVVRCPDIPRVTVTLYDGRSFLVVVERDDDMFGKGSDLARLVIPSGSTFQRYIAPPTLGDSDGTYTVARKSGTITGSGRAILPHLHPGDSGAGVYATTGDLVGLFLGPDDYGGLRIVRVDSSWLEGT